MNYYLRFQEWSHRMQEEFGVIWVQGYDINKLRGKVASWGKYNFVPKLTIEYTIQVCRKQALHFRNKYIYGKSCKGIFRILDKFQREQTSASCLCFGNMTHLSYYEVSVEIRFEIVTLPSWRLQMNVLDE
jgi:hypothetical protein